jgi:hypothetical protein
MFSTAGMDLHSLHQKLKKVKHRSRTLKIKLDLIREKVAGTIEAKKLAIEAKNEAIDAKNEAIAAKNEAIAAKNEIVASKNNEISHLQMEFLRAKGLLSARGIYERVLQNIHFEQSNPPRTFNATTTCQRIAGIHGTAD